MSEYKVIKIEKCDECENRFANNTSPTRLERAFEAAVDNLSCELCSGTGEIRTEVDLLDVLKKIKIVDSNL